MQATFVSKGDKIDHTPSGDVAAGDVVVVGSIPMISTSIIAADALGSLAVSGLWTVVKDSSTITAGDAIYWDEDGDPVGGTASSGACTTSASGNNLMGGAVEDAATGVGTVLVYLTSAERTTTVAGSVTADDITGSDAALGIAGKAGAGGGAGGTATVTGGVGHTNAAGGAVGLTGGAGAGTGAGGANPVAGGASGAGATGNGGAVSATGGAALSTNGTGGAASLVGGVSTGTGTGGAVTITSGASAGASGTAGAVAIDCGAAAGGTAGAMTIGGTNATSITVGKMPIIPTATVAAAGANQGNATAITALGFCLVSAADNAKGVVLPTAVAGQIVIVKNNVVNKTLLVYPASSDAINALSANGAFTMPGGDCQQFTAYDSTTWYTTPLIPPAVLADPGDGGAIPVGSSGCCAVTTTGVDDTRTIADPTHLGQLLTITLDVDAGNLVATAATAVNQTGNNTLTAADAGDMIMLQGVTVGAALVWRVVCNDGYTLSTV